MINEFPDSFYHLAIAQDWEFDRDFIRLIEHYVQIRGLKTFVVHPSNLDQVMLALLSNRLFFHFLFDRASDTTPGFVPLQETLQDQGTVIFEPLEDMRWASDKATMHLEFINRGIHTPYTIILDPWISTPDLHVDPEQLKQAGESFIIKPANTTGGGIGVIDTARTAQDIQQARKQHPGDKYLIQERIIPKSWKNRVFWFRGFYILGAVRCTWWHPVTQVYREILPAEIGTFSLQPLFDWVAEIAKVSGLKFFSTEIAMTRDDRFVVVDYVNESCDMRLQSRHVDGIPDSLVHFIAERIARYVVAA